MIAWAGPMAELTPEQETELHAALVALQEELETYLSASKAGAAPVDLDQPIGRVSRVDAIQQQKMAQAARARNELRLRQVVAALSLARDGEYGYCRHCDDPIGYGRLEARPESAFCVGCQTAFEKR